MTAILCNRDITLRNGWVWGGGMVGRAVLGEPPAPIWTTGCMTRCIVRFERYVT